MGGATGFEPDMKAADRTFADVTREATEARQRIMEEHTGERRALRAAIRNIRRNAADELCELTVERDNILKGDVREWSNLLTARAALEDEGKKKRSRQGH